MFLFFNPAFCFMNGCFGRNLRALTNNIMLLKLPTFIFGVLYLHAVFEILNTFKPLYFYLVDPDKTVGSFLYCIIVFVVVAEKKTSFFAIHLF